MLDIKFIRQNPEVVKKAAKNKGVDVDIAQLLEVDKKRREILQELESFRAQQNKKSNKKPDKEGLSELKNLKSKIQKLEEDFKKIEEEYEKLMLQVPNIPADDVPIGKDENDNKVIRKWGEIPKFDFKVKDHLEIGEALDIIDVKQAAKVTGTRFAYLKGAAVLLEFALIQFAFETLASSKEIKKIAKKIDKNHSDVSFVPIVPPAMIRPDVFVKMARLSEEDKDERYYLEKDDLYLIGSSEHTMGAMHMDQIFNESDLPKRYVGFSTCFRREAGSYGQDTRGILRMHQFDKLEMESFTLPEDSLKEQDFFVAIQEHLMQSLGIPYRVVLISTVDMGRPDTRQIDIESWIPSQNKYRETHTADLMTDYQARRLNTKVRRKKDNELEIVHMNDATVLAIGRTIITILENYQQSDGSVKIPKVLQKYMGGLKAIKLNP